MRKHAFSKSVAQTGQRTVPLAFEGQEGDAVSGRILRDARMKEMTIGYGAKGDTTHGSHGQTFGDQVIGHRLRRSRRAGQKRSQPRRRETSRIDEPKVAALRKSDNVLEQSKRRRYSEKVDGRRTRKTYSRLTGFDPYVPSQSQENGVTMT